MGFSYADSRLIEEAVLAIPAEARSKEGEVYALNCNAAVYLMGDIETSFPYFVNQSWWGTSRPEVIEKTAAYLSGEDRPLYLLAGKEGGTEKDFGAVIDAYYEEAANQIENPAFVLYVALPYSGANRKRKSSARFRRLWPRRKARGRCPGGPGGRARP